MAVSGIITDNNNIPLSDVKITIDSPVGAYSQIPKELLPHAATSSTGTFTLSGLAPHSILKIYHKNYAKKTIELGEEIPKENLNIILNKGQSVAGNIVKPDGTPYYGHVGLSLYSKTDGQTHTTDTADGTFTFQNLDQGTYILTSNNRRA